jgi:hypothetical protein
LIRLRLFYNSKKQPSPNRSGYAITWTAAIIQDVPGLTKWCSFTRCNSSSAGGLPR